MVLNSPFSSQQQFIDHMCSQGTPNFTKEIIMMSSKTISLTTHYQSYEKSAEKKDENPSSEKAPSSSNGPLTIEKPNHDLIFFPPNITLRKYIFNRNARATQFYNIVEYLAQEPCVMSTLEVLQSCPTQQKNLLIALGALDPNKTNLIHFNVENYKSRLSHQLAFQIMTKVVGRKVHRTVLDEGDSTSVFSMSC